MRWMLRRGWMYVCALAVSAFALFPIYYVVITSLKPRSEIYTRTPDLWPNDPQWHQYTRVFTEGHVGRALANSLIVATATTLICVLVAGMAAYALARLEVPLKRTLLMLILTTQMFPLVVLIIPLFVLMRNANLIGTYQGLVVAYLAFTVPLAIWIMRGFILTIPEELEHAAMTDGATRVGAMFRVILPIAGPGLIATATLSFIAAWNEFMLALTFMDTEEKKTLPLVLQQFVGRGDTDWGAVMATSVIYTVPVILFFLLMRKRLMLGMTAGAVKG
ncbi:MAG TPA: carbohydrate ABC transporter permease [Solirubrobacteraceae bacterium]|nr:carbohydrate ABC transporter permease [Solirubrobacteraceae bacterium]